jgi:hypothetical protein
MVSYQKRKKNTIEKRNTNKRETERHLRQYSVSKVSHLFFGLVWFCAQTNQWERHNDLALALGHLAVVATLGYIQ